MTRPLWDMLLSELVGGSDDPDAGRLANEIEQDVNGRIRALVDALKEARSTVASMTMLDMSKGDVPMHPKMLAMIDAAISKAEGQP